MRSIQHGIDWIWYYADSKAEAEAYYLELAGRSPEYSDEIQQDKDGRWSFRLHK